MRLLRRWRPVVVWRCEHGRLAAQDKLDGGVWHVDDSSPCDEWARASAGEAQP